MGTLSGKFEKEHFGCVLFLVVCEVSLTLLWPARDINHCSVQCIYAVIHYQLIHHVDYVCVCVLIVS